MKIGTAGEAGKVGEIAGIEGIEGIEGVGEVEQVGVDTPRRKKLGVPNGRMSARMFYHDHSL